MTARLLSLGVMPSQKALGLFSAFPLRRNAWSAGALEAGVDLGSCL